MSAREYAMADRAGFVYLDTVTDTLSTVIAGINTEECPDQYMVVARTPWTVVEP